MALELYFLSQAVTGKEIKGEWRRRGTILLRGSLILYILAPEESGLSIQERPPVQLFPDAMILASANNGS
jgi:hypothetical protein